MDRLPQELVRKIYRECTPQRRKSLLAASSAVSGALRTDMTLCWLDLGQGLQIPETPSLHRFRRICWILLKCAPPRLSQFFGGSRFVQFDGGYATVVFTDRLSFAQLRPQLVTGISQATFRVRGELSAMAVTGVMNVCRDLRAVRVLGRRQSSEPLAISGLASDTLLQLSTDGVTLLHLRLPALRVLAVKGERSTFRLCLSSAFPSLVSLTVCVKHLHEDACLPSALRHLHLMCVHRSTLRLQHPLPDLLCLSLTNIRAWVHPHLLTKLRSITLHDSSLNDLSPLDLLDTIIDQGTVHCLVVCLSRPSLSDLLEWQAIQVLTVAEGRCDVEFISLYIKLPR